VKRKFIGIGLAGIIAMASAVPVFAAEKTGKNIVDKQARSTEIVAKIEQKAEKLGINIEGLSKQEAKAKIKEAFEAKLHDKSEKLGIDIANMSNKEVRAKIKEVAGERKQLRTEKLTAIANKLGIDISGLTNKEAIDKIKEVKAQKKANNVETDKTTVQ